MADKKAAPTEYLVLAQTGSGTWDELGTVTTRGGQFAAKRQALAQYRPEGATVVAVPSRSWEPEDLKPKLSFG